MASTGRTAPTTTTTCRRFGSLGGVSGFVGTGWGGGVRFGLPGPSPSVLALFFRSVLVVFFVFLDTQFLGGYSYRL